MKKAIVFLTLLCAVVFAQEKGSFKDTRDGKTYKTVKIGTQTWMAENLNYEAKDSKCYDNKPANCAKYGRLYNWYEAAEFCPKGWHLPSRKEWMTLVNLAGGKEIAGKKLNARNGWNNKNNGTDDFGFTALPGGYYYSYYVSETSNGTAFTEVGIYGGWCCNNDDEDDCAHFDYSVEDRFWDFEHMGYMFNVRCLQD